MPLAAIPLTRMTYPGWVAYLCDAQLFWLPATRFAALGAALGYGPATTQRSARSTSLVLASPLKFECREPNPSTVKRAVRWQQGPAFVVQLVAPQKDGKTLDIAGDYIAAF